MGFVLRFIKGAVLFPFKLVKFILVDVLVFGIIGGMLSLTGMFLRLLFKPLSLAALAGAALIYVFSDEERKNKVKALIGV
ncbi:MAG: hypothetical protein WAR22_12520 [Desulfomonilia bacterium]|jgi:hypothetical protein